jgi:hypothetical protein
VTFWRRVRDGELKVYVLNIKLHPRIFLKVAKFSDFAIAALGDDLKYSKVDSSHIGLLLRRHSHIHLRSEISLIRALLKCFFHVCERKVSQSSRFSSVKCRVTALQFGTCPKLSLYHRRSPNEDAIGKHGERQRRLFLCFS